MLKKHMAACLVASAFITMPVLAQTSTSPGGTPGATQPATGAQSGGGGAGAGAAASGTSGRFITQQQQNQWRASRLIGLDVYGADNEKIGDINEVLVDRSGNADAVVVGVGGFLGMGEKNVALPFNAFEWQMEDTRRTASAGGTGGTAGTGRTGDTAGAGAGAGAGGTAGSTAGTGTTGGAGGTAAGTGTAGTTAGGSAGTTASTSPAGTGTTGTTGTAGTAGTTGTARSGSERGYPDHAVLRMTKADLEKAPAFRYVGDTRTDDTSGAGRSGGAGGGTGTGAGAGGAGSPGTAPRQ